MNEKEIGNRIKEVREQKNMTLQDIADKVGIARSTVQRYESGLIKKIKLPVIQAIANALSVNPSWLIGKSDTINIPKSEPIQVFSLSRAEEEHIKKYRTLDEYGKKNVDNVLDNEYTRCSESKVTFLRDVTSTYQVNTLAAHERAGATEEEKQADYDLLKKYINRSENNE